MRFQVLSAVSIKMTVFWDIAPYSLVETDRRLSAYCLAALKMEAVSTSEMSVNFYQTTRHNPEDSHLHTHRRENLEYNQQALLIFFFIQSPLPLSLQNYHTTMYNILSHSSLKYSSIPHIFSIPHINIFFLQSLIFSLRFFLFITIF
jgi:hypothetical protein